MFAFESVIQQCSTSPVKQQQKREEKTWFSIGSHYHPCSPSLLKQSIVDLVIFPSVFSFPLKPTIFHWVTLHNGKSCSPSPIEINDRFTGSLFHQCSPSPIETNDFPFGHFSVNVPLPLLKLTIFHLVTFPPMFPFPYWNNRFAIDSCPRWNAKRH